MVSILWYHVIHRRKSYTFCNAKHSSHSKQSPERRFSCPGSKKCGKGPQSNAPSHDNFTSIVIHKSSSGYWWYKVTPQERWLPSTTATWISNSKNKQVLIILLKFHPEPVINCYHQALSEFYCRNNASKSRALSFPLIESQIYIFRRTSQSSFICIRKLLRCKDQREYGER